MRKVLLTTTALVALGGISAASADVSISGSYGVEYYSESNTGASADAADVSGDNFIDDGLIVVSGGSTADNGLTFGARMTINHTGAIEDQQFDITGDFGYFMAGAQDGVVDGMDGFMLGSAMVENAITTTRSDAVGLLSAASTTDNAGVEKIGYRSNVISGFQIAGSYEDGGATATENDDLSSFIVTYDAGFAKLGYASSTMNSTTTNGADTTRNHYGIGTTLGGVTVAVGRGESTTKGANGAVNSSQIDTTDVGFSYALDSATTIYAAFIESEEKTGSNADDELSTSTFGLNYTLAPGVATVLEYAKGDYSDGSAGTAGDGASQTTAKMVVTF